MDTGTIILILGFAAPVVVVVIIILGMKRSFIKRAEWAADLREKQMHAMPYKAEVINSTLGATGGDKKHIIYFTFEIMDPRKPYQAEAAWFVDTLKFDLIKPGCIIPVKVDADDPKIIYPNVNWAVYTVGYEGLKKLSEPPPGRGTAGLT